jgi:alkylation response protein AidB-like acyl-CoA dehydrogenase
MSRDHALDANGGLSRDEGGSWTERYFLVFASTISAGSSEIQRNIVATQVLGLPPR